MTADNIPPGYVATLRQMIDGAQRWLVVYPESVTIRLVPKGVMLVGSLDDAGVRLLAGDEPAIRFLRAVDAASNHEATIFLVHCMVEFLPAERVRRGVLPLSLVAS